MSQHGMADDDTGDFSHDSHPTAHKMEFSKFDGGGDPLPWLNRCERFFHVRQMSYGKKVVFTMFYLLNDAQLWFHRMELNGDRPTWPQFVQLRRTDTVNEFYKRFIALSYRNPVTAPDAFPATRRGPGHLG
jgi:hypothetical protein